MVICKYFQNGSCRFGTKCINEHFDVKPIIKTEVEAALKGSQWPLSCFGPFKEKMCIPNFIEDQSFEETRFLCYEAKKNNCFPQFAQQFNQQVMEAQNKMKTLLTLNRDVIAAVIIAYNNIPPGVVNNANNSDSTSFFGNSNSTQPNPFSNSLFRNSTTSNESNVFGVQSTTSTSSNNMLGQNNFGTSFGPSSQGSLFGQQTNSFKQPSGSFFSVEPQQQQPSIFQSQPLTFSNTGFGTNPQVNLFGQPQQQSLNTGNVFTQQNQQQSGFGNHNQMQETPQAQQDVGMQQSAPTAGIFGQVQTQTQQQQQQQNIFKQALNQQQNISDMQQQQPQQQQQQQMNLFGTVQPPSLASSFGNTQQQQNISAPSMFTQEGLQQHQQQMVTIFNQSQQQQNNFQPTGNVQSTFYLNGINIDDIPISGNLYTKLEFLKPEEIEAFKADKFEIGRIPVNPPAKELVQFKY